MPKTRQESKLVGADSENLSITSDSSSDLSFKSEFYSHPRRARSLSFDDLYSLVPVQNGLTEKSQFAYVPLEREESSSGIPKSVSFEDLKILSEAYSENFDYSKNEPAEQDYAGSDDGLSVMSAPPQRAASKKVVNRRAASEDDAKDRIERISEIVPDETEGSASRSAQEVEYEEEVDGDSAAAARSEGTKSTIEDESPAVRLFGRQVHTRSF